MPLYVMWEPPHGITDVLLATNPLHLWPLDDIGAPMRDIGSNPMPLSMVGSAWTFQAPMGNGTRTLTGLRVDASGSNYLHTEGDPGLGNTWTSWAIVSAPGNLSSSGTITIQGRWDDVFHTIERGSGARQASYTFAGGATVSAVSPNDLPFAYNTRGTMADSVTEGAMYAHGDGAISAGISISGSFNDLSAANWQLFVRRQAGGVAQSGMTISHAALWNRLLTAQEITDLNTAAHAEA